MHTVQNDYYFYSRYREGRLGSSWRHIKSCINNVGKHIVFLDGKTGLRLFHFIRISTRPNSLPVNERLDVGFYLLALISGMILKNMRQN